MSSCRATNAKAFEEVNCCASVEIEYRRGREAELESELAKRPAHRVEVLSHEGLFAIFVNDIIIKSGGFKEPFSEEADRLRKALAAGNDASKELEELREKVKSLESELSICTRPQSITTYY